ncbi:MAG: AsmA family protein [Cocleimonas sp.]|nr:AsmA family protein [Cocleimonas sp.]
MKPLSRLFLILSILLVLAVAAIVFFLVTFDANGYKDEISALVKKQTGRDLQLNGDIKLSVYPDIALNLGLATFSNATGFGNTPFATVKSAKVGVQLMPLLKKKLVVEKIILDDLQLDLYKKADGSTNWDSFSAHSEESTPQNELISDLFKNLSVAGVELNNAKIHWRDDGAKQDILIAPLNLSTGAFRPEKPIAVNLNGTLQQKSPALSASVNLSTRLTLTQNNQYFTLKETRLKAIASGLPLSNLELSGDITGTLKQLNIAGLTLHIVSDKTLLPNGRLELNLAGDTQLNIEQQSLQIPSINLQATISDLPTAGAIIKANITGNTRANLKNKQLQIAGMTVHAESEQVIAKGSGANMQVNGDAQLDLDKLLLTIKGMEFQMAAIKVLEKAGTATTNIKGNLRADLKNLLIDINTMILKAEAKDLPNIGNIKTDMTGNLSAQLHQQQFTLKNANVKSKLNGNILSGGDLSMLLSATNLIANIRQQQFRLTGMKLHTVGQKLPKIGDIDTHLSGALDAKVKQQLFVMQNANIKTKMKGEIVSGGNLYAQLSSKNIAVNLNTQHFKLKGMNLNATLKGGIVPSGQLVHHSKGNIDINLSANKGSAQLNNIVLETAGAKLTGSAKLTKLSPQPMLTGAFKTNQFNLKQVLTSLGIKLPPTSKANAFGHSQASFQLTATPSSANLSNLNLRIDQSKITGNVAISDFKHPAIKTKLTINKLVLSDYLAPVDPKTAQKTNPNDKLLPLQLLKTLNLNGSIDIKKLYFDQLYFTHVQANINAKNGIIDAKPLRFNAFKGKYNGALTINATTNTPVITMSHQIQQVRAENLLLQFFQDRYVSGGIFLNTSLTTRGNTVAIIKQNLTGTASIEFREGTIRDSELAKNVSLAINAFERKKTNRKGKEVITFTNLGGDWKANRGVFRTENMHLLAPHFLIKGTGNINIVSNKVDLKLRLESKKKDSNLFVPLHIHGSLDKLQYELELDVLVKSLLDEELHKKQAQLKQKLLDQKAKTLDKLEARKQNELQKLQDKKEQAEQRLKAEQDKLKQRLQDEQQKVEQMLQNKLQQELLNKL